MFGARSALYRIYLKQTVKAASISVTKVFCHLRQTHEARCACFQADPERLAEQRAAHKLYSEERWALLVADDVELIKQRGWEASYVGGVGGIVNPSNIKCMHCHLAHYLATGSNVVGRWTQEALDAETLLADTTR